MVLAGGHRQNIDAVGHDDEGGLLAVQVVLNDYPGAGAAELVAAKHVAGRAHSGLSVHGDNHALACRKAVSLDDNRSAVLLDVGNRLILVSEGLVLRGRDVVPGKKVLGEGLGALELCGGRGRSEDAEPVLLEPVCNSGDERSLGAYDGEIDAIALREPREAVDVIDADGNVLHFWLCRSSGVARGNIDLLNDG